MEVWTERRKGWKKKNAPLKCLLRIEWERNDDRPDDRDGMTYFSLLTSFIAFCNYVHRSTRPALQLTFRSATYLIRSVTISTMFARRAFLTLLAMLVVSTVLGFVSKSTVRSFAAGSSLSMSSFYDIKEKDATGSVVDFSKFKGKVVYGVNVATKCGYTASGYALLAKIAKMKADGVEVAIFPCNQVCAQCLVHHQKVLQFFH